MASSRGTTCTASSAVDISAVHIGTTTRPRLPRWHWTEPWPPGADPGPRSGAGPEFRIRARRGPAGRHPRGAARPDHDDHPGRAGAVAEPDRAQRHAHRLDLGRPAARRRGALQSGVSRLRRLIGEELVETAGLGYRLRAGAAQLDLVRFDELADQAVRAADDGAPERALISLDRALRLWRGFPLSNVGSPELRRDMLPGLTERYLRAVEQRSGLRLRLGRYPAVVQELSVIVVPRHPFHERLAGQLMIALVRSGLAGRRAGRLRPAAAVAGPGARDRSRRGPPGAPGPDPARRGGRDYS